MAATLSSCSNGEDIFDEIKRAIKVDVVDVQYQETRAQLFNNQDDVQSEGKEGKGDGFGLSAYLSKDGSKYFEHQHLFYFFDEGTGRYSWQFKDTKNQQNLTEFYWPNDSDVNFVAYMPRVINSSTCAANITDITYDNRGVSFSATMPNKTDDRKASGGMNAESNRKEFVYACRENLNYKSHDGAVKLRFVHPFAMIRFKLHQSHRDLTIHSITLHSIKKQGNFSSEVDTFVSKTDNNATEQGNLLTTANWTVSGGGDYTVLIEKTVPTDVNYTSQIGGPYMVIPQNLDKITISLVYSWDKTKQQQTDKLEIKSEKVKDWEPGKIYTYHLNLGDNREEVLFEVDVEEWKKGENNDYENSYDVK